MLEELAHILRDNRLVVLTGAGCSTESGIPDYRGPETRKKARNPIQFGEFLKSEETRKRYWARATVGWRRFGAVEPNPCHHAIAQLEAAGLMTGLITQNVDRLHTRAGSKDVVELHGALEDVVCLECRQITQRDDLQSRILEANPSFEQYVAELAPDGDAAVPEDLVNTFIPPVCDRCSGPLKPNVVFFGENVPKPVVERAWEMVERAEAMLVVGSSLTVYSGYRFVKFADEKRRMPVGILNLGETRGDPHAWVQVDGVAGELMPQLVDLLV